MLIKNICILSSVHQAFDVRIFNKEAKTLINSGYNVTLICQHDKTEVIDGIKIIGLQRPYNRFFRIFRTNRELFHIAKKENADIYHFHDPELIIVAILLKMLNGAKLIYDVHEDVPQDILTKNWIGNIILRKIISLIFDKLEKLSCIFLDTIVAATPDIARKFPSGKTTLVGNMPIISATNKIKYSDIKDTNFSLVYAGGLTRIRGIKETIQALNYLENDNIELWLLGKWENEDFKKECQSLKEWNKVKYLGWVPFKEANNYLLKADAGLVCFWPEPNHVESMPNKIFEYMEASLPIIASNFPSWKKIIEGNNCGVCVNPRDPKKIAEAIKYLMEHPDKSKKMGESGRKVILAHYNWEIESKKLLNVYNELCKNMNKSSMLEKGV